MSWELPVGSPEHPRVHEKHLLAYFVSCPNCRGLTAERCEPVGEVDVPVQGFKLDSHQPMVVKFEAEVAVSSQSGEGVVFLPGDQSREGYFSAHESPLASCSPKVPHDVVVPHAVGPVCLQTHIVNSSPARAHPPAGVIRHFMVQWGCTMVESSNS